MLYEYQFVNNIKQVTELDTYCKLEGKDTLNILSIVEKEENLNKTNKAGRAAWRFLRKLLESI